MCDCAAPDELVNWEAEKNRGGTTGVRSCPSDTVT